MKLKRIIGVLLCLCMLMPNTVFAATPRFTSTANVYAGESVTWKTNGTVKEWKSSNKKVATVTKKGKVTGIAAGTAKISAKIGKKTISRTITVNRRSRTTDVFVIASENKTYTPTVMIAGKETPVKLTSVKTVTAAKGVNASLNKAKTGMVIKTTSSAGMVTAKVKAIGSNGIVNYIVHCYGNNKITGMNNSKTMRDAINWGYNQQSCIYSMKNRNGLKNNKLVTADCSSFVYYVYKKMYLNTTAVKRKAADKSTGIWNTTDLRNKFFTQIKPANARPGDILLVTKYDLGGKYGHVRMYIGGGRMMEMCGSSNWKVSDVNLNKISPYKLYRIKPEYLLQ